MPATPWIVWLAACTDPAGLGVPDAAPPEVPDTGAPAGPPPDTATDTDTGVPTVPGDGWARFLDDREQYLADLGAPILACVDQQDTSHPVFHGCVDWHSSVHATWALHVLSRLTGDPLYLETADAVLDPAGLAVELARMQSGDLANELPYGFSWLLLLAREREATTGARDLVPLADEAELQLTAFLDGLSPRSARTFALSDEYANLSWAVLHLWEQAVWNGDAAQQAHWTEYARTHLLPLDAACPLEADADRTGFFPPCLHRARTLLAVLPPDEAAAWLDGFLPGTIALAPRTRFPVLHQAGQNFSRSWGLWALWQATGDPAVRDLYLDHVVTHVQLRDYWAEEYWFYAHWVPQFGVHAVALSYE